jgi:hypothetical protein
VAWAGLFASVIDPSQLSIPANGGHELRRVRWFQATIVNSLNTAQTFFNQLEELCLLVQKEFLARFDHMTDVPASAEAAAAFTERLMLCPTVEAVEASIRQDLEGALSFIMVLDGLQQRVGKGNLELPADSPAYQTKFYLLACAAQEYLAGLTPRGGSQVFNAA